MFKIILPVLMIATITSGCSITNSRTVVEFDGSKTDYSTIDSMKTGKACFSRFLMFPTSLDASIATAAKNGGVSKILHVDQVMNRGFMHITEDRCTVVYGN